MAGRSDLLAAAGEGDSGAGGCAPGLRARRAGGGRLQPRRTSARQRGGDAGRGEVLVDGGIRRGTDVLKALALGARAVLISRPYLWGLALGGEEGALRVLELLRNELATDLLLCGLSSVQEVDRGLIVPAG